MSLSAHDRISGHPARARVREEFIVYALKQPGVVFMRKDQIARFAPESPITVRLVRTQMSPVAILRTGSAVPAIRAPRRRHRQRKRLVWPATQVMSSLNSCLPQGARAWHIAQLT